MNIRRYTLSSYVLLTLLLLSYLIDWGSAQNFDTSVRIWLLSKPWGDFLHNVRVIELAPPLWHFAAKVTSDFLPFDIITETRVLNFILFSFSIPLTYLCGYHLLNSKAGWYCILIQPWYFYTIGFITRTDHYILYYTLTLAYTYLFIKLISKNSDINALYFSVCLLLFSFTHYYSFVYIFGTYVSFFIYRFYTHSFNSEVFDIYNDIKSVFYKSELTGLKITSVLLICLIPFIAVYSLWLPSFIDQYLRYESSFSSPFTGGISSYIRIVVIYLYALIPSPRLGEIFSFLFVAPLGLLGLYQCLRSMSNRVFSIFGGSLIGVLIFIVAGKFYSTRHALWVVAISPLAMGIGAEYVANKTSILIKNVKRKHVDILLSILILSIMSIPTINDIIKKTEPSNTLDKMAEIVKEERKERTSILTVSPWGELVLDAKGVKPPIYGIPSDAVEGNRALNVSGNYNPDKYPEHRSRVREIISEDEKVIVFSAHGNMKGRLTPLLSDIKKMGYDMKIERVGGVNGVYVLEKHD